MKTAIKKFADQNNSLVIYKFILYSTLVYAEWLNSLLNPVPANSISLMQPRSV